MRVFTFLAVLAATACPVPAANMAAYFASGAANDFSNRSWTLGWEFNVLVPIDVTALGFYDAGANGLAESHDVAIYGSAGNLIVSATVQPADPLTNWWRFASIAPVLLPAASGYRIAAVTGSEYYTWDPVGFATGPGVVYVMDRYSFNPTLVFPTENDGGFTGYFGPNFLYEMHQDPGPGPDPDPDPDPGPEPEPIPEPSTLALIGAGLLGFAALRRRCA